MYEGGQWLPYSCVDASNQSPLVVAQLRYIGKAGVSLHRYYLLTAQGRLYVAEGPKVA